METPSLIERCIPMIDRQSKTLLQIHEIIGRSEVTEIEQYPNGITSITMTPIQIQTEDAEWVSGQLLLTPPPSTTRK